jgi:hypothetical protein
MNSTRGPPDPLTVRYTYYTYTYITHTQSRNMATNMAATLLLWQQYY